MCTEHFIYRDGKKLWNKEIVHGYSDEVMLTEEPADNQVPIEGCDEVLTYDEIMKLFPNQRIVIEIVEPDGYDLWKTARVLWIHCDLGFCLDVTRTKIDEPKGTLNYWPTYSEIVGGAYLCL